MKTRASSTSLKPKRVGIVLYPDVELLDVTGPLSILHGANRRLGRVAYDFHYLAATPGLVPSSCGLALQATQGLLRSRASFHTLLVPGGEGTRAQYVNAPFIAALRRLALRAHRVVSVCTGSFLLAQAQLLQGKPCTSHWAYCEDLRKLHPECEVKPDPIFVHTGKIWTSAGVTAGLDLALALLEADHGKQLAIEVARWMVLYLRRPGGQNQYSLPLQADAAVDDPFSHVLGEVREHPGRAWPVATLAKRLHLSERQLSRLFQQRVQLSPAAYVERARIEAAQRLLVGTDWPQKRVASSTGYHCAETFLRSFVRITGITPAQFRERFSPTKEPSR